MAYNKFKLKDLKQNFGIENKNQPFIPESFDPFPVSERLLLDLYEASTVGIATEKAKSEHIVLPVLKELYRKNANTFSYFSGYEMNVDSKLHLKGFCDFILSLTPHTFTIECPIFCLVEAKKDVVEDGWGQCGAEMYAAKLLNEREKQPFTAIYGCVTNAFSWSFLKLVGNQLLIDPGFIPLSFKEPHKVLSVLQWILNNCIKEKQMFH